MSTETDHKHIWDLEGYNGTYWYQCECGAVKPWPEPIKHGEGK